MADIDPVTTGLIAFLLGRITEEEVLAQQATARRGKWVNDNMPMDAWFLEDRVLVECQVKREIIQACVSRDRRTSGGELAESILQLLTVPYAKHPQFRLEWQNLLEDEQTRLAW